MAIILKNFGSEEFDDWDQVKSTRLYQDHCYSIKKPKTVWNHLKEKEVDPEALDLLERMCRLDPQKRPSARDLLKHPFFEVELTESERIALTNKLS